MYYIYNDPRINPLFSCKLNRFPSIPGDYFLSFAISFLRFVSFSIFIQNSHYRFSDILYFMDNQDQDFLDNQIYYKLFNHHIQQKQECWATNWLIPMCC